MAVSNGSPHAAGTGSALLGTLQMSLGVCVAPVVGLGGSGTAVPVFAGMAACALIAVLALRLTRSP
jgi:DHA1 family bicyclomycin/chloramphenicol resistance-like MFS transporter